MQLYGKLTIQDFNKAIDDEASAGLYANHLHIICISLQTVSLPAPNQSILQAAGALPDAQPTVSMQ